jgi:hypothetical protein
MLKKRKHGWRYIIVMTAIKDLVRELDTADLFLRDRIKAKPTPLTEYDIMLLQDAANASHQAARLLEKSTIVPYNVGDTLYYISKYTGEIETDTVKFITITKNGAKPILEHHNIRFWEDNMFGYNVFWSEAEAVAKLEEINKEINT